MITCQGRPIRSIAAELGAWPLVAIVIEHVDALGLERLVDFLAGGVGVGIADLEVDEADLEGRHRLRPDDAGVVMARPR